MSEFAPREDNAFLIKFDNDTPISASEIGLLLRELSGDYKKVTGGRLVLWRYETGSSWIYVRDAIAVAGSIAGSFGNLADATQNMVKFVSYLRSYFDPKFDSTLQPQQIAHVAKSATRIAKIAAHNGANVEMTYINDQKSGIESFSMKLSTGQAEKLTSMPKTRLISASKETPSAATEQEIASVEHIARQLGSPEGTSEDLVSAIVSALKMSGADHLLPSLASSLEDAGRYEIAEVVRRHIRGSGKGLQKLPVT